MQASFPDLNPFTLALLLLIGIAVFGLFFFATPGTVTLD
jgi:hypothetical protein